MLVRVLAILACLSICLSMQGKVYLVAVGISDYPGKDMDLTHPANDTKTIAWLYSQNSEVKYKLLLNEQATKKNILDAIDSYFSRATERDIVVFYFSGHGYDDGFIIHGNILYFDQLRKAMAKSKSRNKMIFADACRAGSLREDKDAPASGVSEAKRGNVMMFLSSRSDEPSRERIDMTNGYFTTYLYYGLRGSADANGDRTITAKELFDYVNPAVAQASGEKQHPVMWGRFPSDMPILTW